MDKSLKIVLTPIAIYLVLGFQFFIENNVLIIPYMFNPIVLLITSGIITYYSFKKNSFGVNLAYFFGVFIYCFTSERTLNLIYNYTNLNFCLEIIQNPFLRLFSVLGFLAGIFYVLISYLPHKYSSIPFVLLIISSVQGLFGLIDFESLYVVTFTLFSLSFLIVTFKNSSYDTKFNAVSYQLILFSTFEGLFFLTM